ncbi:MAG: hypothetical protein OXC11_16620, partial [Rhodospirillales bacterium]|nr:hypothetical protein [Rhodospirillales bacterium]
MPVPPRISSVWRQTAQGGANPNTLNRQRKRRSSQPCFERAGLCFALRRERRTVSMPATRSRHSVRAH